MARAAKKLRSGAAWDASAQKAKRDLRDAERSLRSSFAGQTFADLTPPQKDDLLKAVAIRLGIIEE